MLTVALIGPFKFPTGEAASARVMGLCGSLVKAGFGVTVISGGSVQMERQLVFENECMRVSHYSSDELIGSRLGRLHKLYRYLFLWGVRAFKILGTISPKPDVVIVYGGWSAYACRALVYRWVYGAKIVADVVEWYDGAHMVGGRFGLVHLSAKAALRFAYPKFDGVICISRFLERYYRSRGVSNLIRIPPTVTSSRMDMCPPRLSIELGSIGFTKFVFAGNPGKKELFSGILAAYDHISQNLPVGAVSFVVIGVLPQEMDVYYSGWRDVSGLSVLGRIPQEQVWRHVADSDYSLLFRQDAIFSRAGFSTKFVESLFCGTPVVGNITGDLDEFLIDGVTGIVSKGHDMHHIVDALLRAHRLNVDAQRCLRNSSYLFACSNFSDDRYVSNLHDFITSLCVRDIA
jgi:glycosyltransferase involved in cell wall biosynthesis